jgi:hypothetical protein
MRSQDPSMPPPTNNEDDALFIITVKKSKKLIEQLMSKDDQKKTGFSSLTDDQKAELNAWLDTSLVVAPGNKPGGPVQ